MYREYRKAASFALLASLHSDAMFAYSLPLGRNRHITITCWDIFTVSELEVDDSGKSDDLFPLKFHTCHSFTGRNMSCI